MEQTDIYLIVFFTIIAIIGLIFTFLQKKGRLKPVLTQTSDGFHFMSGGVIAIVAAIFGAMRLYQFSLIGTILYLVVLLGIYILIQIFVKK